MNKYLKRSIVLHIAVFVLFMIDLPNWHHDMTLGSAPIIVDLSQVRIDEMTNLPSKAEFGPEDRKATVAERKKEEQYLSLNRQKRKKNLSRKNSPKLVRTKSRPRLNKII